MTKLIGIIGHSGVGKDTFGGFLYNAIDIEDNYKNITSFAAALRAACAAISGLPTLYFSDQFYKNKPLQSLKGKTPKEFMQKVGTKLREVDKDIFINYVKNTSIDWPYDEFVIITDVRLQNEIDFVLDNEGVLIHLTRPGYDGNVGIPGHETEAIAGELGKTIFIEGVIHVDNSGTLDDLRVKAKEVIKSITL